MRNKKKKKKFFFIIFLEFHVGVVRGRLGLFFVIIIFFTHKTIIFFNNLLNNVNDILVSKFYNIFLLT